MAFLLKNLNAVPRRAGLITTPASAERRHARAGGHLSQHRRSAGHALGRWRRPRADGSGHWPGEKARDILNRWPAPPAR